jgi:hypothetical protein
METTILKPEPMSYGQRFVMTFAMVALVKNLPLITVLLASKKTSTPTLVKDCNLQKTTGDPLVVAPPVNDTTIKGQASTLSNTYDDFLGKPPTATSAQVTTARNTCINSYNQNAMYIQGIARNAAIAAGDVSVGIQVVIRCGYKVKKTKAPTTRVFKVTPSGIGAVEITTKAVAPRAGYIRQYGPTTAKNVVPAVIAEDLYSLEADVHVTNLKSGTIYGFREASILPLKRAGTNSVPTSLVKKAATPTIATNVHKVTFSDGAEHYTWSNWVYVVIQ